MSLASLKSRSKHFLQFLFELSKPVVIVFHTVLPHPDEILKSKIKSIAAVCESIIVMTHNSEGILTSDYGISPQKISVIAHGTHLVPHLSEKFLKKNMDLRIGKSFQHWSTKFREEYRNHH